MKKFLIFLITICACLSCVYANECSIGIGSLAEENQATRTPVVTLKCTNDALAIYKNASTEQFMRLQLILLQSKYKSTTCEALALNNSMPMNIYYQCNFEKAQ